MPTIDRRSLPDRLGKERNRPSQVLILAVILVAVLMLGAIAGLMVQIVNNREMRPSDTPVRIPAGTLTTAHGQITIYDNGGFTNASGVTWGSGTASDPYIMADWDITPSLADGIVIQDTDAHFMIRNCHVHDGSPDWDGISLWNCVNGTLVDNNCSNNYYGVFLYSSSNNTLINNTFSSNDNDAIDLYSSSDNNTLINNDCSNGISLESSSNNTLINNDGGIFLSLSSDNTLSNNNCSSNSYDGILLYSSNRNALINNTCGSNDVGGIWLDTSSDNTLVDNNCSSNNQGGILLYQSNNNTLINNTCNSNPEGMLLDLSSNNTLSSNYCLNNFDGMLLDYASNNNTLSNNNCSSNQYWGIAFFFSCNNNTLSNNSCNLNYHDGINLRLSCNDNEVSRNMVFNNAGYGVNISSGSGNRVWNNTFISNNGATSTYDASHVQARDDGTHNWWNSTDGYGNWWSDWQSPDIALPYGIVDLPYSISGSAGAMDNYPLTTPSVPIPEFGMMPLVVMVLLSAILLSGEARRKKKP